MQSQLDKNDVSFQEKNNFYEAVKIYYRAAIEFLHQVFKSFF